MAELRPEAEACDGRRVGGPRLSFSRMAHVEGVAKPRPEAEACDGRRVAGPRLSFSRMSKSKAWPSRGHGPRRAIAKEQTTKAELPPHVQIEGVGKPGPEAEEGVSRRVGAEPRQ